MMYITVLFCTSLDSYVTFVLSLFIPYLFFVLFLGKVVLRKCGIFWVFLIIMYKTCIVSSRGVRIFRANSICRLSGQMNKRPRKL